MRCQLRPLTPPPSDMSIRSCRFSHCFVSPAEKYSFRESDFPSPGVPEWTWAECWAELSWVLWPRQSLLQRFLTGSMMSVCLWPRLLVFLHVPPRVSVRMFVFILNVGGCSRLVAANWRKKKVSISIKKKNKKPFLEHIWMASRGFWWLFTVFMSVVLQSKMQNAYCSVNTVERVGGLGGWGVVGLVKKYIYISRHIPRPMFSYWFNTSVFLGFAADLHGTFNQLWTYSFSHQRALWLIEISISVASVPSLESFFFKKSFAREGVFVHPWRLFFTSWFAVDVSNNAEPEGKCWRFPLCRHRLAQERAKLLLLHFSRLSLIGPRRMNVPKPRKQKDLISWKSRAKSCTALLRPFFFYQWNNCRLPSRCSSLYCLHRSCLLFFVFFVFSILLAVKMYKKDEQSLRVAHCRR